MQYLYSLLLLRKIDLNLRILNHFWPPWRFIGFNGIADLIFFIQHTDLPDYTRQAIMEGMAYLSEKTCIKFHARTSADKYGIEFYNGGG